MVDDKAQSSPPLPPPTIPAAEPALSTDISGGCNMTGRGKEAREGERPFSGEADEARLGEGRNEACVDVLSPEGTTSPPKRLRISFEALNGHFVTPSLRHTCGIGVNTRAWGRMRERIAGRHLFEGGRAYPHAHRRRDEGHAEVGREALDRHNHWGAIGLVHRLRGREFRVPATGALDAASCGESGVRALGSGVWAWVGGRAPTDGAGCAAAVRTD